MASNSSPIPEAPLPQDDRSVARRTVHQVNNFLSVVTTYGELALARGQADAQRKALEVILAKARDLETSLKTMRRDGEF